jgi:hypothetical protein
MSGISCWHTSIITGRRGSIPVWMQLLFDMPTADVTGRIVEVLAGAGLDARKPAIQKALVFLLKTQSGNGGCWSRWWAGYLVGASFVLRAFGNVGLRHYSFGNSIDSQRRMGWGVAGDSAFSLFHWSEVSSRRIPSSILALAFSNSARA